VALAQAGWTVATIEYRRVPGRPSLTVEDVALSLKVLPRKLAHPDQRVLAMGHSAGGHLTLWAASMRTLPELHGALALAPVADLQLAHRLNLDQGAALAFLGDEPTRHADLDPTRMPSPAIEVTLVHGDADQIVPLSASESYLAAHARARLVRLDGSGHFALIDPESEVWPTVVRELERLAD
jgi:acetyl esterase/lipase